MVNFIMEGIVVLEKSRRWICKFIVLFLFITGMCFEEVKADSIFLCTIIANQAQNKAEVVAAQENDKIAVYRERGLEVTEIIVARSTTSTQQLIATISSAKKSLKISVAIIYVTALGLLLSNSFIMAYVTQLPERVCKTIVVNYIHNTDGKKRI